MDREEMAAELGVTVKEIGNVYADGSADRLVWSVGFRCDGCAQDKCTDETCVGCRAAQTRILSGYYPAGTFDS